MVILFILDDLSFDRSRCGMRTFLGKLEEVNMGWFLNGWDCGWRRKSQCSK